MSLLLGPHELIPRTGLTIGDVLRQLHECASREWGDFLHKSGKEPTANAWLCRVEPIAGIGYLSSIWRLCFLADDGHEFRAVIKSPNPTYVAEVNLIKSKEELDFLLPLLVKFHNREVHFYAELVPNFLADTKFASFLPRAFAWKSCEDVAGLATAFLILEDLSERGSHPQAMDSLSNQQIESLICALAQLHAHSLAIPSTQLDSLRLRHTHLYKYPPEQVFERLCDPGSECGHFFNENRQALEQMVQWVLERAERGEDICAEFGIQPILSHGDLWTNNLLFSKQNPNQLSAILDWQFARPSTGLNDLAHLLLGSVDVELRRERQAGWLRLYREEMARWAKQLGRIVPIDSEELAQRIFQRHMPAEIYFQMQMLVLNEAVGESGNPAKRRQIRIREMFVEWLAAEKTQMVKQV